MRCPIQRPSNRAARTGILFAAAVFVSELAFAQLAPQPAVPQETTGVAIDGARHPVPENVRLPGQRLAPDAVVDAVQLPATRPPAADIGAVEAGYVDPLPSMLVPAPNWTPTDAGGHVWTVEFTSPDARALRVRTRGRWGLDGLELRVYAPRSGSTFGPDRGIFVDEQQRWWTTIIFGDSIGLEFHVPPGGAFPPQMPEIDGIAYHNVPPPSGPQPRGCDLEDVTCHGSWANEASAVCMLASIMSNGNVNGYCSGALLNRNPSDGCPLVMTANHCDATAQFTVFIWNYQTSACDGTPPDANTCPRNNGAILLRRNSDADWNILALRDPPLSNYFLGWDSGFWVSFADGTGIHHPDDQAKKISFGYNEGALYGEFEGNWYHTWGVRWTTGSHLGGSSGSPVLDSSRRVRGTLTGSYNCDVAYFGQLDYAYETLQPFLNNIADPVYVDVNHGGNEYGTPSEPFDQMIEGVHAVIAGHTVRFRAGSYNEQYRIWRPMRLEAEGGLVRIGAP